VKKKVDFLNVMRDNGIANDFSHQGLS